VHESAFKFGFKAYERTIEDTEKKAESKNLYHVCNLIIMSLISTLKIKSYGGQMGRAVDAVTLRVARSDKI
jgi:hypothetical protein